MVSRLGRLIRAKLTRRLGRAEDPAAIVDLDHARQREELTELRNAILELVTAKKRLERHVEHRRADLARLDAGARRARELGEETLARRAIERRRSISVELVELVGEVAELEAQQSRMIAAERSGRARLERLRARTEVVRARFRGAKAELAVGESAAELSAGLADVSAATRRLQDQVDEISVRASALEELERAGLLELPGDPG